MPTGTGVGMSLKKKAQTSRDSMAVEEKRRMEVKGNSALGLFFKAKCRSETFCHSFSSLDERCLSMLIEDQATFLQREAL